MNLSLKERYRLGEECTRHPPPSPPTKKRKAVKGILAQTSYSTVPTLDGCFHWRVSLKWLLFYDAQPRTSPSAMHFIRMSPWTQQENVEKSLQWTCHNRTTEGGGARFSTCFSFKSLVNLRCVGQVIMTFSQWLNFWIFSFQENQLHHAQQPSISLTSAGKLDEAVIDSL